MERGKRKGPSLLPLRAIMIVLTLSDHSTDLMVAKTVGLSRFHRACPTLQMLANSTVPDFLDWGIRFHKNFALQLD